MNVPEPVWVYSADELARAVAAELPKRLRKLVTSHPRYGPAIAEAWDAGWRDAQWLTTFVVVGCDAPDTLDAVGQIVYRLMEASDQPCPEDRNVPPKAISR